MNSRQRRQRAMRRTVAAVVVLAVAGAGVGIGFAVWGGGPSGYRTGVATTASVEKTLSLSGVFEPVQQSAASFQVAGTVASVSVTVGQQVTAGQTLASLTSMALQDSLTSAQSNLSAAQAKLTQDESGEATTSSYVTGGSGGEPGAVLLADTATTLPTLAQAQQAVVTAQQTADADLQTAAADLAAAETACAGSSTTTGTVTSPVTGTAGSPVTGTSSTGPDAAACAEALTQAEAAQTQVSTDQQTLASAESTLSQVLAAMASTGPGSGPSPSPSGSGSGSPGTGPTGSGHGQASPQPSPSGSGMGTGGSGTGTGGSGTGASGTGGTGGTGTGGTGGTGSTSHSGSPAASSTPTNSAQQLATDQASIDMAEASVVEAQQSLDDAQLTAPIAGTVAAVNLAAGQTVPAGSSTDTITVVNSGGFQTMSSLTSSQVAQVAVGDTAQVTVDGASGTITGTVSRVGPVNASSSSTTYPLVVALTSSAPGAADGATARVTIDVAQATDALVVPTSAVHSTGVNRSYVITLAAGQETEKPVVVGVVGSTYTQVMSGITKGTTVVLADYSQAVPATSSNSSRTFGGGGFTGGTFRVGTGGARGFGGGGGGGGAGSTGKGTVSG